jgi:hypothetical protein
MSAAARTPSTPRSAPPKRTKLAAASVVPPPLPPALFESDNLPVRNEHQQLVFSDFPHFRPNLAPSEILRLGSFGGTYFRPIRSAVTQRSYEGAWQEFPADWFEGLDVAKQVASSTYDAGVNKYKVKCGGDLHMWESSGWIAAQDPYGWFQWYCRFFLGRRSEDDERQVQRGMNCFGPKGRWRNNLITKVIASGRPYAEAVHDQRISPVVRQTLQHWGYALTLRDLQAAVQMRR